MSNSRLAAVCAAAAMMLPAQTGDSRQKLIAYLDGLAHSDLAARREAVARIQSRAQAEERREMVRRKIIALIGGLPESHGPVAIKTFGTIAGDGFRIEKLAFESLPGFWATANVYVPASGAGPFPAVVLTPGHEATGKIGQYGFGTNFARLGIVALAFDPIGQGERLQYFDAAKNASQVGAATGEHGEANLPTLLVGDDLERYMVHDGMRAIDYLVSRPDVDGTKIGALGCSGGGTATAVLAALDPRVAVAGTACYITSFDELLPSATGVQEAEQSIPHFIQQGLDFADWVEAAAPRPYAIISTESDMFPFAGARQSYEEAKRIYGLYGADDRLAWITGPGGHGNLGPISPQILTFFTKYLKGDAAEQQFVPARPANADELRCLPAGQVTTALGPETVWSLNRQRAPAMVPKSAAIGIRDDLHALAGIPWAPVMDIPASDYTVVKGEHGGRMPGVLWLSSQGAEASEDAKRLAQSGKVVMILDSYPWPEGTESVKSPYLGAFNLLSLRAFLVGDTIVGLRTGRALTALAKLRAMADVVPAEITVYGKGAQAMVALDLAVVEGVKSAVLEDLLASYRSIVDVPLHRNASEVVIPGVLRKFDVPDLLRAVAPRQVIVVHPLDGAGDPVSDAQFRQVLGNAPHVTLAARLPW